MNEYNERVLKTVLQDYRAENDDELLKEIEDAKNDPLFQVNDEEAKAFAQKYVKKTQKKPRKLFLKVASIIFVIIFVGAIFIPITVEGRKSTVAQLIFNFVNSEFLAFESNEDEKLLFSYEGVFVPTYIPEGYCVESVNNTKDAKYLTLVNDTGKKIVITEQVTTVKNIADYAEGVEIENITFNGYEGIYYTKDGSQYVFVLIDDIVLSVICSDEEVNIKSFTEKIEKR